MKVVVTGQGLFLREHVVTELRAWGHDVRVIDGSDRAWAGQGSVSDAVAVLCGFETCAVPDAEAPDDRDLASEHALLDRIVSARPKALILLSSAEVYGTAGGVDLIDEDQIPTPESRLGLHALALEDEARVRIASMGIALCVLRTSAIGGVLADLLSETRIPKAGRLAPGFAVADLSYPVMRVTYEPENTGVPRVTGVVSANDAAGAVRITAERLDQGIAIPGLLNIGSGAPVTPGLILEILSKTPDTTVDAPVDAHSGERLLALSCVRARAALGWGPATDLEAIVEGELALARLRAFAPTRVDETLRVANEYLGSSLGPDNLTISGLMIAHGDTGEFEFDDLRFSINRAYHAGEFFPRKGLRPFGARGPRLAFYRLGIPRAEAEALPTQVQVQLVYSGPHRRWFDIPVVYAQLSRLQFARHSRLFPVHGGRSRLFVRQRGRGMFLTLRENNVTDTLRTKLTVLAARVASLIYHRPSVLLYEKQSSQYEESASVVFESLIDSGHDHVHFVLDRALIGQVPERYRSHVIPRFSFRHFYHFFAARTLVGTELGAHAIELRTIDRFLLHRLHRGGYNYVFLQHGVMYMVALSSAQRSFFRAGTTFPKRARIVCSSELEKRHFVELGGFASEQMYVCGLPKLDHSYLDSGADRILIAPTWRPWEQNVVRTRPAKSRYYKMLVEMYEAVPDRLKDKTWILPHPLFRDVLRTTPLGDRIWAGDSYDEALRGAALLLTDYSSISYDAFYRGANVVFWWKEKDYCMEKYGGHLMLEEHTAFGPVCMDAESLASAVDDAYLTAQDADYVARYRDIVEFHDGHNTDRLIAMMEHDRLIRQAHHVAK